MSEPLGALNLPPVDPLPEATQKYFDICQEKLGMVPNVLRAYAFDIDKLNAFTALYNDLMLAESGLSKLEREMIAVVVSSVNKCFYCLTAHGAAVRQLSGDPQLGEMMVMNWRVADLDARQTAMLTFAEKITKASAEIVEADAVVKGQTASSSYKPAVLDNGVRIMVPPHIESGTRIIVDVYEQSYVGKAN